ncbi:MAG: insulinase family protein, partial [Verrucomicrobiota bacterium]
FFNLNRYEYSSFDATTAPENWEAGLAILDQELRRAQQFGFTQAEFEEARAKLLTGVKNRAKSADTRKSADLANGIASRVGSERVFTHPADDLSRVEPFLASTTAEECHDTFLSLWSPEAPRSVYASGNVEIEEGGAAVLASYQASQNTEVEAPADAGEIVFAYPATEAGGAVTERTKVEDLAITQLRFANAVRANLRSSDVEKDTIYLSARIGPGKLAEPREKPGLAKLFDSTFISGGLEAHSQDELKQLFAAHTVQLGASVGDDAFTFSGKTTPEDLPLLLDVFVAYLQHPGFRPEAHRQFLKSLPPLYTRLTRTPDGVMMNEGSKLVHSDDSRFGYPEESVLSQRTLDELQEWVTPYLESGYLEIALVGDLDTSMAIEALSRTVGNLPERKPTKAAYTEERLVKFPQGHAPAKYMFPSEIPRSMAMVYWSTADMSDIKRTRRLGLLSTVLRDRLRIKVREELGDAYSPYARNSSSETFTDYGYLFALIEADPAQAQELADLLVTLGHELAESGVSEDELDRARKPMLTMIEEYRRTNGYWLNSVLAMSQEFPQRLDWARHFVTDYESITKAELDELASTYLRKERALPVLILPEEVPEE